MTLVACFGHLNLPQETDVPNVGTSITTCPFHFLLPCSTSINRMFLSTDLTVALLWGLGCSTNGLEELAQLKKSVRAHMRTTHRDGDRNESATFADSGLTG